MPKEYYGGEYLRYHESHPPIFWYRMRGWAILRAVSNPCQTNNVWAAEFCRYWFYRYEGD